MLEYLRLIRAKQWIKNLFVFVPAFFSGLVLKPSVLQNSFLAFVVFCCVSSAVYILNDYFDREKDRQHPDKKHRPLAAGSIPLPKAWLIFGMLLCLAVLLLLYIDKLSLALIIGIYFVMNLAYSFRLKQIAIIDIFIIAFGFVLRVLAGGEAIDVRVTDWAILLNLVLALVFAAGKRRGELRNADITGVTRKSLEGYNVAFLDIVLAITCTIAIVCYIMFTLSHEVQQRFNEYIIYTVVFVIFGILRYLQQSLVYNRSESPTKLIYRDFYIQATVLLWLSSFLLLIYFK